MTRRSARQYAVALQTAYRDATDPDRPIVVRNFLRLLTRRRATKLLPRIFDHLQTLADQAAGTTRVLAWSARAGDQTRLGAALRRVLGDTVVDVMSNPALVGGLKLQIGDLQIDGTVRGRLERLQTHLAQS